MMVRISIPVPVGFDNESLSLKKPQQLKIGWSSIKDANSLISNNFSEERMDI